MKEEKVRIYDENGIYLNKKMDKKEAKIKNLYHKAIHLWIMIGDKILIQQRSELKKVFPNKWDLSVAGHISEDDSSLETVIKELYEELNIKIDSNLIEYLYSLRRTGQNGKNMFFDTYLLRLPANYDLSQIKVEKSEVKAFKLVNKSYLDKVINNKDNSFASRQMECKMFIDYINGLKGKGGEDDRKIY